jgi:N-methylhydantoinase A
VGLSRFADMKFSLQIHELEVPVPAEHLRVVDVEAQVARFIARYEQTYGEGSAFPDAGTQIGVLRLAARGRVPTPELSELVDRPTELSGQRDVHWGGLDGFLPTDIVGGTALAPGHAVPGPAIIQLADTTVVVPPGATATMDRLGSIGIAVGARASTARRELSASAAQD